MSGTLSGNAAMTYEERLSAGAKRLAEGGLEGSLRDARLLLLAAASLDSVGYIARQVEPMPSDQAMLFDDYIARRLAGEPVFRILGQRDFHGLSFRLGAQTLEPRDDTEALVELTLDCIGNPSQAWRFADLGTGTGAVGLSLLSELPQAHATLTDVSEEALTIAVGNALVHGLQDRVSISAGSWCEALDGIYDFIVSNPPYIASSELDGLTREVLRHDPRAALDGGSDGLDAYRAIFEQAGEHLTGKGFIAVETGFDQKADVTALGHSAGWHLIGEKRDLSGNDRALAFRRR